MAARRDGRLRARSARAARALVLLAALYLVLAYLVLPALWRHHEHNPRLAAVPMVTRNGDGIPCDPLNVALVGTRGEVEAAMTAAGWRQPQPVDVRSGLGIAESVLLDRADPTAPVSSLYLWGRRQDLAFEQEVGPSARERHHVRFWDAGGLGNGDRPLWVGAATFDRGVGLSHRTGQITHHIAPDLDAERDDLMADLAAAGRLTILYQVTGIGPTLVGWNGGGDRYFTDGEMTVGVLAVAKSGAASPERLPNPPAVALKNRAWSWLRPLLR
jgi:hypothetical protein